jgi:hypothetical protein
MRRLMAVALVAVAWAALGGAVASGAEYRVSACGESAGFQNHLLSASVSDGRMSAYTACPNDGDGHFVGLTALAGIDVGKVPVFANAIQTFTAPAGTTIQRIHLNAEGRTWNGDWAAVLQASTDRFASNARNLSGCTGNAGSANGCWAALREQDQEYELPGTTAIRALVACGNFAGCTTFSTDRWPFSRAYYFIHSFDVTLADDSNPAVSATGGGLASGQWLRGTQSLTFDASDNSGIRRTRFWADDLGNLANDVRDCDYTFAVPCTNVSGGQYSLDTTRLSDGQHVIAADGLDATDSNWSQTVQTVHVDNHAPAEPGAPGVVGGEGWRRTNGFVVKWSNPGSAAPIDRAFYELCRADGSGCTTDSQANAGGIEQLSNVQVPGPGDYTIRVWLEDAAGNVSDAKSAPLHLKFDDVAPAQAAPQHRNGWVNRAEAGRVDQEIRKPEGFQLPVSGIGGYAVTTDGAVPGTTVEVVADPLADYAGHRELIGLPEGTTTVRARAISGAGVASPDVGTTEVHVDQTPPTVSVTGVPNANLWTPRSVGLHLMATDSGQLSGMASGPIDRGVASGGYIEYSVDGGDKSQIRGPQRDLGPDGRLGYAPIAAADLGIDTDGVHSVTYQAFDVAGNGTAETSVSFKIDQTPPELAVFEAQQQSDPRLVTVAAADRTSGLADGGKVELRRISPTRGDWITLRTTRDGDRYFAHIDNATLPEGEYEFRALIHDQAGNEAVGTMDRDGKPEVLHITPTQIGPYPTGGRDAGPPITSGGPDAQDAEANIDSRLTAQAISKITSRKCTKPKKRKGRRRCGRTTTHEQALHEIRVGFGKGALVRGVLTTSSGAPIADAEVTVLARPAVAGSDYEAEASTRTDAWGAFSYRAPAGPSRTLDFHYRGDRRFKHADDQVTLRVPAAATIRASRHSVRNGRVVTFTGRLRGGPYPAKGKVLDLQAFYRKKWRTFATPRAATNGGWRYRYRFQATRGVVLYKFRIRVRPSSDYPYELGYSKTTKVRVSGR